MVLLGGISNKEKTKKFFNCTCVLSENCLCSVWLKYECFHKVSFVVINSTLQYHVKFLVILFVVKMKSSWEIFKLTKEDIRVYQW